MYLWLDLYVLTDFFRTCKYPSPEYSKYFRSTKNLYVCERFLKQIHHILCTPVTMVCILVWASYLQTCLTSPNATLINTSVMFSILICWSNDIQPIGHGFSYDRTRALYKSGLCMVDEIWDMEHKSIHIMARGPSKIWTSWYWGKGLRPYHMDNHAWMAQYSWNI